MSEETTQTTPETASEPTQPNTQGAPDAGSVESALRALASSKGLSYGGEESDSAPVDVPPEGGDDGPAETPAPAPAAAAPEAPKPPPKEVPLEKYARIEAKAREAEAKLRAAEQKAAELERRVQEDEVAWKQDPLGALHRKGLSTTDLNKRALDLGEPKPDAPAEELPAWAQELKRQNEELSQWRADQMKAQQQVAYQQAREREVGIIRDHLGKFDEFSLVNELGEHEEVLTRISKHLAGGRFEDDEQAATVIAAIARERETELQNKYRADLAKPKLRAFLERELRGTQSEETPRPARTPGQRGPSNTARPASADAPRNALRPAPEESGWSRDEAFARALDEARPLMRATS